MIDDIRTSGTERRLTQRDLALGIEAQVSTALEWLKTARNLVK